MGSRETINQPPVRIPFGSILAFVALLYVGGFFVSGRLMTELPTNWFTSWVGGIFALMDAEGFFNVWSGLTPGFHYFYFILWKPLHAFAGGQWYFATLFSLIWFFLTTGFVFLSAYLFYKVSERLGGAQRATIMGTIFLILLLTFEWYTVIDSFALAAFMAAIYYSLKNAGKRAGVLLAISTCLKPLGFVILPVIIRSEFLSRKTRIAMVLASGMSVAGLFLPFIFGNFRVFMSSFNWQSGRAPWETVYSFALWLSNAPLPTSVFFQDYSGIAPRSWGWSGITPVHSVMTTPVPAFGTWYGHLFVVLLGVGLLGFLLFKRVRNGTELMWGSLFAMAMFFVIFYGWSVQFLYWLAPFTLSVVPLGVTALLKIVGWIEYPLFYGLYMAHAEPDLVSSVAGMSTAWTSSLARAGEAGYWSLILVRSLLFLGLAIMAWRRLPARFWEPASHWMRGSTRALAIGINYTNHRLHSSVSKGER